MKFINLHTHKNSNNSENIEIVNQYPSEIDDSIQYYSTGIHPWKIIEKNIDQELAIIENHLKLLFECLNLFRFVYQFRIRQVQCNLGVLNDFQLMIILVQHFFR